MKDALKTHLGWLRLNVGRTPVRALTDGDIAALRVVVALLDMFGGVAEASWSTCVGYLAAFRDAVEDMQPETRWAAFHLIAHRFDWDTRERLWALAGLNQIPNVPRCEFEPRVTHG